MKQPGRSSTRGGPYYGETSTMKWAHIYTCLLYIDVLPRPTSFHKKTLVNTWYHADNVWYRKKQHVHISGGGHLQNCQIFAFKSFDHICLAKWKRLKSSPLGVFQIGKAYRSKIQQRFVEKTKQPVRELWMIEGFKIIGALPYRLYWMVGCALESRWHRQFSLMLPTTMQP